MRELLAIRKQKQEFARAGYIEIDENLSDSDTRPVMMDKSTLADTILQQLENVIEGVSVVSIVEVARWAGRVMTRDRYMIAKIP